VSFDTSATTRYHADRTGVVTAGHELYHVMDVYNQKSPAEIARGDQPTSATGSAEAARKR